MQTDETLSAIFQRVGSEVGFEKVEAKFGAFRDFKVKWERSFKWANFVVSDYLDDAPDEVIEALADTLLRKMRDEEVAGYPEVFVKWVDSVKFCQNKQDTYIRRGRGIRKTTKGQFQDLEASRQRLIKAGLIEDDPAVCLTWKIQEGTKAGECSVLMKVISLSTALDRKDIPEYVLDYCLYREYCFLLVGFVSTIEPDSRKELMNLQEKYLGYIEAEDWLSGVGLHL